VVEFLAPYPIEYDDCVKRELAAFSLEETEMEFSLFDVTCGLVRHSDSEKCSFAATRTRNPLNPKQLVQATDGGGECLAEITFAGYSLDNRGEV